MPSHSPLPFLLDKQATYFDTSSYCSFVFGNQVVRSQVQLVLWCTFGLFGPGAGPEDGTYAAASIRALLSPLLLLTRPMFHSHQSVLYYPGRIGGGVVVLNDLGRLMLGTREDMSKIVFSWALDSELYL